MKRMTAVIMGTGALALTLMFTQSFAAHHEEAAKVGGAAPDFKLKDLYGKEFSLSEFKDKVVVLEWLNIGCPVSKGAHEEQTMQKTYRKYAGKGVVWLGIDTTSGASAEKDRVYGAEMMLPYPILMDAEGKVGHAYGAKTTPHMFVIDKTGKLAYAGAIDDKGDTNYVANAIEAVLAGKEPSPSQTKSYGCGIKYPK